VRIDAGENPPDDIAGASGLVFMGGHMSVNDPLDWIGQEVKLIRAARQAGLPVLGHCLGAQLIARSLGGEVKPNPDREIGWHTVWPEDTDAARDWFGDTGAFECFHWHGEGFSLPGGAAPLLRSRMYENQGFVMGNCLALQCHIEMTADMVRTWSERFGGHLDPRQPGVQSAAQMLENIEARIRELNRVANRVYGRWVTMLGVRERAG
jgi:GMP synthase-like glutamine amidotransferase